MDDQEVKAIIAQEMTNSLGYEGGKLPIHRIDNMQAYFAEPLGNEQDGRSQVVMTDPSDIVETIQPNLMKLFCSTDRPVEFQGRNPDDDSLAKQVSEYINYVVMTKNTGYENFSWWFKDALIQPLAFIKVWFDQKEHRTVEEYKGITKEALEELIANPDIESIDTLEVVQDPQDALDFLDPTTANNPPPGSDIQPPDPTPLYDVKITLVNKEGSTMWKPVPNEEILVSRHTVTLDDCSFICHRQKYTRSDLYEMAENMDWDTDVIDTIPSQTSEEWNLERLERFQRDDEFPYDNRTDKPMEKIWLNEIYVKIDINGDGKAELYKIFAAGDIGSIILSKEEVDTHPFISLCSIPIPHKLIGNSVVDLARPYQLLRTTLMRSALDNAYLSNAPRVAFQQGTVNPKDLANWRPGAPISVNGDVGACIAPVTVPYTADATATIIEYVDQCRDTAVGVNAQLGGLDPNTLQVETAAGVNARMNAAQERVALIARNFAETGVKKLFLKVLELECKNQNTPQWVQLNGTWQQINPSMWKTQYDLTINVGLGTGTKDQRLAFLQNLIQIQQTAIALQKGVNGPLVNIENVFNALQKLTEAGGERNPELYFTDPHTIDPQQLQQMLNPPPPQDPAVQKAQMDNQNTQAQLQAHQQESQAKMQMDNQKMQFDHTAKQQALAFKQQELEVKERMHIRELQQKAELEMYKINQEMALKREEMLMNAKSSDIGNAVVSEKNHLDAAAKVEAEKIKASTQETNEGV